MKKWISSLVMGLLLSSTAWAQVTPDGGLEKGTLELGAFGGISIPVGEYRDLAKPGLTLGVPFGYYISPKFVLGIELAAQFTGAEDTVNVLLNQEHGVPIDAEVSLQLGRFDLYGRYKFRDAAVSPYVVGMFGYYVLQTKVTSGTSMTFNEGYVGGALGLGVQWVSKENVSTYLEALYHYAGRSGGTSLSIIDVRLGLAFML